VPNILGEIIVIVTLTWWLQK